MGKSLLDFIPDILESAVLTATGNPEFIPLAIGATHGIKTGVETGNPLAGLVSGVGSGAGSYLGGSLLGGVGGALGQTPANALGDTFGADAVGSVAPFGSFAGNVLGSSTIGSTVGQSIGSSVGDSLGQSLVPPSSPNGPPGFSPSQSPSIGLPQSLSQLSGLTPDQQASNIASKGVYGGGQGSDENNYFLNLINRQLFDKSGNVQSNLNGLAPVDMSYLNQLGISGSTPTDVLKGISQYGQA